MDEEKHNMPSSVFYSKRHDTGTSPVCDFTPPIGTTWDLTENGLTAKFIARLPNATVAKIVGAAVVTGPWQVTYNPTTTDVDTIGAYDVEVQITRSNGKTLTFPTEGYLSWVINPDLDDA
jgi:aryl-phospho-beta-D-glucosidase BglC (GH1 family)